MRGGGFGVAQRSGLRDLGSIDSGVSAHTSQKSKEASSVLQDFLPIFLLESYRVGLVGTKRRHRRMLRWVRGSSFFLFEALRFSTAFSLSTSSLTCLCDTKRTGKPR